IVSYPFYSLFSLAPFYPFRKTHSGFLSDKDSFNGQSAWMSSSLKPTRLRLCISAQAPVLVLPVSSLSSRCLVFDLGHMTAKNAFRPLKLVSTDKLTTSSIVSKDGAATSCRKFSNISGYTNSTFTSSADGSDSIRFPSSGTLPPDLPLFNCQYCLNETAANGTHEHVGLLSSHTSKSHRTVEEFLNNPEASISGTFH
ncbi:unnamed protein product, partial [Protopolystoma xenopodis]